MWYKYNEGDHYRTRLTHTLEVAQISRTIARALRLNEDLVEAIASGHPHTLEGKNGILMSKEIREAFFKCANFYLSGCILALLQKSKKKKQNMLFKHFIHII